MLGDDPGERTFMALLTSLDMLIEFGDAFAYRGADFRKSCGEVGFRSCDVIPLTALASAAVAGK